MALPSVARRTFVSNIPRLNVLTGKKATEPASVGAEGPHRRDKVPSPPKREEVATGVPSTIKGDWVLFHPVYTSEELRSVDILHRESKTFSDRIAYNFVGVRCGFWLQAQTLPPNHESMSLEELRKGGYIMDERQWLRSIAGVPGMVAAALRHLRSLRLLRRDSGWIHTLLEEAENERMHLMTFLSLRKPGLIFRAMLIGAQGVFYNTFFLCYMLSPRTCHRFVGHLEEEAVITYTRCIQEIEAGRLPEWANHSAPEIAKDYWRLEPSAKLLDVIYAVRSDESTHRFVNHSLANLKPNDINPFALREPDMTVKGKKIAFDRDEAKQYAESRIVFLTNARILEDPLVASIHSS
ncbi:alternative oxidase-domain-containing protein [Fomitopsis serialis]|uniref:alternative oxidase-domain-containing protein n=1 Tax=Fomitopsis serialis TaxID=139415 RepID=UPI002008CADE|nr:alternative oxidase-domain-containing protein [Neoantrodia serialis]KAH9936323.1 alternative oxidase-domain-containing protein [Neoantrodia serialis]